ncbi:MAG: LysM peptidoglycan-binding domain-containing protein [Verrucomicrobia bacterium]|nr:LysM peptidoglycan-binding domain-containing protein [Verrucomicrobiota bacterium]MCF7708474.1 LysM peptidoglycan-binding domain-containing protein [Verrucomicrobiota bacterium]
MKRSLSIILTIFVMLVSYSATVCAQDETGRRTAAEIARQNATEQRFQRLDASIEDILAAIAAQQKRINSLEEKISQLRSDIETLKDKTTKLDSRYATRGDVDKLAKALEELDKQRAKDKEVILKELEELAKAPPVEFQPTETSQKMRGYEYVVKKGDTLSAIVEAYRNEGVKVTVDQVVDANPNLNPDVLKIGQKIFIPDKSLN